MAYKITLSESDIETIAFVGGRYAWADALLSLTEGENEVPESEAWEIRDAFDADCEGGHEMFPMLDLRSDLCEKLVKFYEEVV